MIQVKELLKDIIQLNIGILIGENKADLHEWLKFQKGKSFINKNIVDVYIV